MTGYVVVACKAETCRAPIIWAKNETTDKLSPIDSEPVENGNVVLTGQGFFTVLGKKEEREAAARAGTPLRTNHFQTCPDRERFRR